MSNETTTAALGYSVIYSGPVTDDAPEAAQRIADGIAARLPYSAEEAFARLTRAPFALLSGVSKNEADRLALFLRSLGAQVEVREEERERYPIPDVEELVPVDADSGLKRQWHGAWFAFAYTLAPGLLIVAFILLAGVAQIVGSHLWANADGLFWPLSAAGWITVAIALVLLLGIVLLRLTLMNRIVRPPDLSTPIRALVSYFSAINVKHWRKALGCLAYREDGPQLAALSSDKQRRYLKNLKSELVLPERIDPAGISIVALGKNFVELRVSLTTVGRKPIADGTRLRRTFFDVFRFVNIDGAWFLLDGFLLGQWQPDRLPAPGCRECGHEAMMGEVRCSACETLLPPYAQESEQWLVPRRKPDLAALFSAIIPGLGQTYNGQPLKGAVIASTSWAILPWAAGVIDAAVIAERINRKSSSHDLSRHPALAMGLHVVIFAVVLSLIFFNAERLPLLRDIIAAGRPPSEGSVSSTVVARFRGADGSYSILFPYGWDVTETIDEEATDAETAVRAISPDGSTSILISTKVRTGEWAPCPQAMEARRLLEERGEEIANVECGTKSGREQYRLDSYTVDRDWRRTLLVLAYEKELVILTFACPVEQQEQMTNIFDRISESLRFAESSRTPITR